MMHLSLNMLVINAAHFCHSSIGGIVVSDLECAQAPCLYIITNIHLCPKA